MTLKFPSACFALAASLMASPIAANEPVHDPVGFGAKQPIPATLTLNYSAEGRNARLNPVYNHYRPKVVFGGREVTCGMKFAPGLRTISPGESGEVHLECREPVAVPRAGTRLIVREGKDVGYVDVHLPPVPADAP